MRKARLLMIVLCGLLFLASCSNNEQSGKNSISNSTEMADLAPKSEAGPAARHETEVQNDHGASNQNQGEPFKNQKVVYTAELQIEIKDLKKATQQIEEKVKKYGGYIVQSNTYRNGDETFTSTLTVRIPQNSFEPFLTEAEELASNILQRNVNGTDVSEEYVDLEARLKSKRAVESRLLEFMEKAQTTEDLLKISSDLAAVQEEIEQITGRIQYLDNQVAYSTVTITMNENHINIPELTKSDLNTWEKIKRQFMTSINVILSVLSGTAVFIIGNLPILILVGIVTAVVFYLIKRKRGKNNSE